MPDASGPARCAELDTERQMATAWIQCPTSGYISDPDNKTLKNIKIIAMQTALESERTGKHLTEWIKTNKQHLPDALSAGMWGKYSKRAKYVVNVLDLSISRKLEV